MHAPAHLLFTALFIGLCAKLVLMSNLHIRVIQQVGLCSCMAVQLPSMMRTVQMQSCFVISVGSMQSF